MYDLRPNLLQPGSLTPTTETTAHFTAFCDVLRERVFNIWSDFESGLIFTSFVGVPSTWAASGEPIAKITVTSVQGTLVPTSMFRGISADTITLPGNFGEWTPHMSHFLDALDRAFMLAMFKWASSTFLSSPKTVSLDVPAPPSTVPIPGVGVVSTQFPENEIMLNEFSTSGNGGAVGDNLGQGLRNFLANKRLFPEMTDYMDTFITNIGNDVQSSYAEWRREATVYGGVVVAIASAGMVAPPIVAAQRVTSG